MGGKQMGGKQKVVINCVVDNRVVNKGLQTIE